MPLLFLLHVLYSTLIDWLIFKGEQLLLLTACAGQLLYNLRLIELCSACAKQNAALNASDACSLLTK